MNLAVFRINYFPFLCKLKCIDSCRNSKNVVENKLSNSKRKSDTVENQRLVI